MPTTDRPIGFWLKHLDNLIEQQFGATLAAFGATRRDWQVLNTVSAGPRSRAALTEALAPFWSAGEPLDAELSRLTGRGWVTAAEPVELTAAGRRAHAALFEQIRRNREQLLTGLSTTQYTQTVQVLAAMAHNVESAA